MCVYGICDPKMIRNVGSSEMEMASELSQRSRKTIFGMIAPWPNLTLNSNMYGNLMPHII